MLQALLAQEDDRKDAVSWLRSLAENTPGLKTLAESTRAVEQVFRRDDYQLRLQKIANLEEKLKKLREEKIIAVKMLEIRRKSIIANASRLRSSEPGNELNAISSDEISRRISLCEDRLQVVNGILAGWATLLGVIEGNILTLQHQSEEVIRGADDLLQKSMYSIEDYSFLEMQIEEIDEQIKKEMSSRNAYLPERGSLFDRMDFLRKEADAKTKELEAYSKRTTTSASEERDRASRRRVLQEELDLVYDKISHTDIKIKKIDLELLAVEDEIAELRSKHARLIGLLVKMKRNLVVDVVDIAKVKAEKDAQEKTLNAEKERIRAILHEKTFEKERVRERHEGLKISLANLRLQGKDSSDEAVLLQAQEVLDKNIIKALDTQISLLTVDDDFAHALALEKSFYYVVVSIRYQLSLSDEISRSSIDEVANTKRALEHDLEKYKERHKDAIESILHMGGELDRLKKRLVEISGEKSNEKSKEIVGYINDARESVRVQLAHTQKIASRSAELLKIYQRILRQCVSISADLESRRVNVNIWRRSARGISGLMLIKSLEEIQHFSKTSFWKIYDLFDPSVFLKFFSWIFILGLFFCSMFYAIGYFSTRHFLQAVRRRLQLFASSQNGTFIFWYLNVLLLFFDAALRQFSVVFSLFFFYVNFKLKLSYWGFLTFFKSLQVYSIYCLVAVFVWLFLASDFLSELRLLNVRLSNFFYGEKNQQRTTALLDILFYATAITLPIRSALKVFSGRYEHLPNVLFAGYSLLVIIALAFFFEKDDFTTLVFGRGEFWLKTRSIVEYYFYPIFSFFVILCLLANPYVGYSQLAWYLAFFMPISIGVIYFAQLIYGMLREKVVWVFIEQRDEEFVSRFEHAKVYYGFFVTVTFFSLTFLMVGVLSHIWGFKYNFSRLFTAVSDDWVIPLGPSAKLGIIELLTVYLFVVVGYLATTLINKFILSKVFEVFGAEPGAQNTFSRIVHIVSLIFSLMLGCSYVGLAFFVYPLLVSIVVFGGMGARDLVADFVAGLLILLERQIEIGHYISTENTRGIVYRISARSTIIRTAQNYFVVIPNRNLISHSLFNWGAGKFSVGFEFTVTVGYENDPDLIISLIRRVMNAHALVLRVPAPVVRLENFSQLGADYFVRAFVSIRKVREQWEVASDIRVALYKTFREKTVVFPYPKMVVYQNANKPDDAATFFKFNFDPNADVHADD